MRKFFALLVSMVFFVFFVSGALVAEDLTVGGKWSISGQVIVRPYGYSYPQVPATLTGYISVDSTIVDGVEYITTVRTWGTISGTYEGVNIRESFDAKDEVNDFYYPGYTTEVVMEDENEYYEIKYSFNQNSNEKIMISGVSEFYLVALDELLVASGPLEATRTSNDNKGSGGGCNGGFAGLALLLVSGFAFVARRK